jgi:glycosyltransferase involved in cell wall biosynthesis
MRLALIAHVVGFQDGQGRVNYEVARAALDAGIEVTLIAESCDGEIAGRARVIRLPVSSLPSRLLKNLSFAVRSARWLERHGAEFDLVQANGFITFAPADVVAAHFVHTAWLAHPSFPFRSSLAKPGDLYQRFFTAFNAWQEKRVYRNAKRVIAVSRKTAREVQALGVPADRLRVLYNGVDLDAYHPGQPERAYFNLPEGVPLALFVGDLKTPRKNLETVLRAMQTLPELHLAVAGATEGSAYPGIARELGVADRVYFLGKTNQVPRLMRSADIFLFPSRYEAHPLVVMEALASGLAVIVSSNVAEGEDFAPATLILQDADDIAALAALISGLLASPERLQVLRESARTFAAQMGWSTTAAKYLEVYAELQPGAVPSREGRAPALSL